MKRYLYIAATSLIVFAACSDVETLKKDIQSNESNVISFVSYSQGTTKAENNGTNYDWQLKDHHSDFYVYGYKNVDETPTEVFNKQKVEWNIPALTTPAWNYSPARYWDKAADSYYFYAAAPAVAAWTLNPKTASIADDYFTYEGYSLSNHDANLAAREYVQSFNACRASALDLMIAAPCPWAKANYGQNVSLQFNHILSRLNVLVKRGDKLTANDIVTIKDFKVYNLYSTGDFDESEAPVATAPGTNGRWDGQTGSVNYEATNEADLVVANWTWNAAKEDDATKKQQEGNYILQSLVVPQNISFFDLEPNGGNKASSVAPNAYFYIEYEIYNSTWTGTKTENFKAYYNLAAAFGASADNPATTDVDESKIAFNEGWQNNLILKINPDKIEFDAAVAEWGDNTYELYDVK